jgi:hypothetical protein
MDWILLTQDRVQWRAILKKSLGWIKSGEFVEQLRVCQLVKTDPATLSACEDCTGPYPLPFQSSRRPNTIYRQVSIWYLPSQFAGLYCV